MSCGGYMFYYEMECYEAGLVSIYHAGGDSVPLNKIYIGWEDVQGWTIKKSASTTTKCDPNKTQFSISDTLHISYNPIANSGEETVSIKLFIRDYSGGEWLCQTLSPLLYSNVPLVKC
jgi:hypothetical protein